MPRLIFCDPSFIRSDIIRLRLKVPYLSQRGSRRNLRFINSVLNSRCRGGEYLDFDMCQRKVEY